MTPPPAPEPLGAALRELTDGLAARRRIPHAIVAVEATDGSWGWAGAAGHARPDGTPMEPETPFHLASITKLYTATLVGQLAEAGALDYDESIAAYLPERLVVGLHRIGGADRSRDITVANLLGHTSGLPDFYLDRPKGGRSLAAALASGEDRALDIEEVVELVRDLRPHFAPQSAEEPRQRARYSDTNYQLLGAIIERVTGQTLHEALTERVLAPLGLAHTHLVGAPPIAETPSPAAIWAGEAVLDAPLALRSMGPNGGLVATASDVLAFLRALVSGAVFDDPATPARLRARFARFGLPRDRAALQAPGWPIESGLGVLRWSQPRWLTPGARMPTVLGHTGSTGTWAFHCPELDVLLVGGVDQITAAAVPYRFVPKLLRAVGDALG